MGERRLPNSASIVIPRFWFGLAFQINHLNGIEFKSVVSGPVTFVGQEGASTVKALAVGAPVSHNEAAWPGTQCPVLRLKASGIGLREEAP